MKLFIVGFMGSGKTTFGRQLAEQMGLGFFDLDEVIENRENLKINDIFGTKGEDYFRRVESEVLREFGQYNNFVLACGGGTPCFHNNMKFMNDSGTTVWVDTPAEVMADRLSREAEHRPLVRGLSADELLRFIQTKLAERTAYYRQASVVVDPAKATLEEFVLQLRHHA